MGTINRKVPILHTIIYYSACLGIVSIFQFTDLLPNNYQTFIGVNLSLTILTSVYIAYYWQSLKLLLKINVLSWKPLVFMFLLSLGLGSFVYFLPEWINQLKFHESYQVTLIFWDSAYPQLYALLFLCLQPAIFEELAFRGFIYNNLSTKLSITLTIFLSSFLFAALHLSILLMLWLVPIGLLFAYFRYRHQSLWYGIIGHFCYNFAIIFFEFYHNWMILR